MRYIAIAVSAVLAIALCGCQKESVDPEFLSNGNLCLMEKGRTVHSSDPLTWQTSFNRARKEFRVHTDNMSDYYILKCSTVPESEGQSIKGSLQWSGNTIVNRRNLDFRVEKMDSEGRVWLWCGKSKIAVSVVMSE